MREIKFRAWDACAEEMLYSDKEYSEHFFEFVKNELKCVGIDPDGFPGDQYSPPGPSSYVIDEIMQYTGLKDKNGKEIYEGDIVFFEDFYIGDHRQVGGNGLVKWFEDGWCVIAFGEYQACLWDMVNNYSAEIIGNIHENPELLS